MKYSNFFENGMYTNSFKKETNFGVATVCFLTALYFGTHLAVYLLN